ncbi:hypothetical protein GQ457_07G039970 [Hibiscus cannabinus]
MDNRCKARGTYWPLQEPRVLSHRHHRFCRCINCCETTSRFDETRGEGGRLFLANRPGRTCEIKNETKDLTSGAPRSSWRNWRQWPQGAAETARYLRRGSALRERLVMRNCSAWTVWLRGRPGNSRLTPRKIRPDDPIPTAPTWYLEIGGRAKIWADLTNEGRSWSTVWPDCLAICSASAESITNLGRSILRDTLMG